MVGGHSLRHAYRERLTNRLTVWVMDTATVEEELEPEILRRAKIVAGIRRRRRRRRRKRGACMRDARRR